MRTTTQSKVLVIRRLVRHLPVWVQQEPLGVMCVLLGLPSGLAALIGPASSRALDTLLPFWARPLWAGCLVLGCLAWAAGITSVRQRGHQLVITRLPVMILGLQLISLAALVYGLAIIVLSGWAGLLAAFPLFAVSFGTAVEAAVHANRQADHSAE